MMRFIVSTLATAAIFLAASAASATVTISLVGSNLTTGSSDLALAVDGDQVQIDVFVSNDDALAGAALGAFNLGAGLSFVSGSTAHSYFNTKLAFGILPTGGLGNQSGTDNGTSGSVSVPRTLGAADIMGDGSVRFMNGVGTSPVSGDGSFDRGVGGYTGAGSAHASLVFAVNGTGSNLSVGTDGVNYAIIDSAGAAQSAANAVIQVGVVPEPATAVLMGLGLGGLSLAGRRRS